MSDLLSRIDPDGTLVKEIYRAWIDAPHGADAFAETLIALHAKGVLRDPAEPTLAEIREKVARMKARPGTDGQQYEFVRGWDEGWSDAMGTVLALLEPREKPEPPAQTFAELRDLRIKGYIAVDPATTEDAAMDALIAWVESRGWTFMGEFGEASESTRGARSPVAADDTAAMRAPFDALRNAPQFVSGPSVVLRRDLDAAINAAFGPKPKPEPEKRYVHERDYGLWVVRDTSYGPNTFMSCCTDEHDARRIADALNATIVTVGGRPLADVQAEVARSVDVASAASEVPNTSFNQTGYGK